MLATLAGTANAVLYRLQNDLIDSSVRSVPSGTQCEPSGEQRKEQTFDEVHRPISSYPVVYVSRGNYLIYIDQGVIDMPRRDSTKAKEYQREWYRRNRDRQNALRRARYASDEDVRLSRTAERYKLNLDQLKALLTRANWSCEICGIRFEVLNGSPYDQTAMCIDHDHNCCSTNYTCGKCVRGVLCRNCNSMIGFARDQTDRLAQGMRYLEERKRDEQLSSM